MARVVFGLLLISLVISTLTAKSVNLDETVNFDSVKIKSKREVISNMFQSEAKHMVHSEENIQIIESIGSNKQESFKEVINHAEAKLDSNFTSIDSHKNDQFELKRNKEKSSADGAMTKLHINFNVDETATLIMPEITTPTTTTSFSSNSDSSTSSATTVSTTVTTSTTTTTTTTISTNTDDSDTASNASGEADHLNSNSEAIDRDQIETTINSFLDYHGETNDSSINEVKTSPEETTSEEMHEMKENDKPQGLPIVGETTQETTTTTETMTTTETTTTAETTKTTETTSSITEYMPTKILIRNLQVEYSNSHNVHFSSYLLVLFVLLSLYIIV
jgi:hypothetical protein